MKFEITSRDPSCRARTGLIRTERGLIHTPVFMPVGTQATVKAVHQHELLNTVEAEIILANTYHLYLRPSADTIREGGGIHEFMDWERPILTDSGGYQIYSLSNIRKIDDKGVTFQSHIDGSKHRFTPRESIQVQRKLGADFIMAFDECTPYPCEFTYAKKSVELTHQWLKDSIKAFDESISFDKFTQTLIPIVQGSTFKELRKQSAEYVAGTDMDINAIGGLSVGEPGEIMYEITDWVCGILPEEKPRYLMGVGTPENLLECIALGVDMFDCVLPTRNARHGLLYTSEGTINIKNKRWERDFSVIDPQSSCYTSVHHSKAYLRHLFVAKEWLGAQIASLQNLCFYATLIKEARDMIRKGQFADWKSHKIEVLSKRL